MRAARFLAFLVAAAFAFAPLVLWLLLPEGDEVTWRMAALAVAYVVGAGLLALGARTWYGRRARLLRAAGFVVLLAGALANVSLAFALVPLALLAAPSLRSHDPGDRRAESPDTAPWANADPKRPA